MLPSKVWRRWYGSGVMSVWLLPLRRVCRRLWYNNIWPGAGEGRKKNYLEEKRAIIMLNRDKLKLSTMSSLLSPPVRQLSFCLNTSTVGTTYGYCECRATFVPFRVSVDYHPTKVPNFGAGTQVLHFADNSTLIRISFFLFLLILFPSRSVQKFLWIK